MIDLTPTIQAKSDQLNADDLIGKPRTIKVSRVSNGKGTDQPIVVSYDGDNGKPYKPCKSMRRILVHAWGSDGTKYVGRSMTLFNDPSVTFGGMAVGGIRISHLSHIDKQITVNLSVTRGKKKPYVVKPLIISQKEEQVEEGLYDRLMTEGDNVAPKGLDAYKQWFQSVETGKLTPEQRELFKQCHAKWKEIAERAETTEEDDECPV